MRVPLERNQLTGEIVDAALKVHSLDLLVEDTLIVELKAVEALAPIHQAQIISYLKLARKPVGLLINFHSLHLKDGIKRFVV